MATTSNPPTVGWLDDIIALLHDADEQLRIATGMHDRALNHTRTRAAFRTRVKNILEHQRSALDYLAVGLANLYGTPKGLVYYPLAQSPNDFEREMNAKMPGVMAHAPAVANAVEQHQPYNTHGWLRDLNQLTREQKHNRLSLQLVREVFQCRVTERATGAAVQWHGLKWELRRIVSVGGALAFTGTEERPADAPKPFELAGPTGFLVFGVPLNPHTQEPYPSALLDVQGGPLQQWCFLRPHTPVLDSLGQFQSGVVDTVKDVVQAAGL